MRISFTLALLMLCLWPAPLVQAQQQDLSFEQVRLPGGSTQNFVTGIAQDQQGFLWLATHGGLLKYDGYHATTYRHNPLDSLSVASDWVETVYVDREGTLWIGTWGDGLDRFDPRKETFTHFRHDPADPTSLSGDTISVMLEDRAGTFWVGTHSGLNRMDRKAGTFTRFRHDPDGPKSLSDDEVRVLYEDRAGTLWIGTGNAYGDPGPGAYGDLGPGGLNRFEREMETFTRYVHDPQDERSLIDSHVQALFEDSRGTFWVGTFGDGLHSMDRQRGTFTRHGDDPSDPNRLSGFHREVSGTAGITFIHEDHSGALWIGAFNGGVSRYDPATGTLAHYAYTSGDPNSLDNNLVWKMYASRDGVLWVMTWGGLFKVVHTRSVFRHHRLDAFNGSGSNNVQALHEDREGTLWVGTEAGGLSRFAWSAAEELTEAKTGQGVHYLHDPEDPQSLSDNGVLSIHEDREGVLWVGTASGLDRLDRSRGRFTRHVHDPEDPESLGPGAVRSIYEDQTGVLWVGTSGGGLNRFDRRTGRSTRYLHDPADPHSLGGNSVVSIYGDREGILWISTLQEGLNRFDPATGRFRRYPYYVADASGLSDAYASSIYEDDEGTLWIGTLSRGLNRFDRRTGRFTHFTTANSDLPDDRVVGILGDEEGNLWLSTGSGLVRFDPRASTFYTYDLDLDFSFELSVAGIYKSRSGAFFLGGQNGFWAFSPEAVLRNAYRNPHPPQVVLTGLRLPNQPVQPGPHDPSAGLLWESREVRLAHDQNTFSLDYVGLHFENPAKHRYAYMLEGYDEAWREVGTERQAHYYKVPWGRYVFRAKAGSASGVWSEEGASLSVTVLPPWWRTWWAYALYGLLFAATVFAADRTQRRRLIRRERARAERETEKLRTEAAEHLANYLQSENQRQTQELDAARHLQLSMLPECVPRHPTVELAAFMKTATEVGGDYYDFDLCDDGTLTIIIGDATGHGASAGTMVTATKGILNVLAGEEVLEHVLMAASEAVRRMHLPKLYMALALVRLRDHTLELVGAGMPPALVYRAASGCVEEVPLKGMPLGGPGVYPYRRQCLLLSAGDTVVLMSDGFPELLGASGQRLGYERMPALFAEAAGRSPEEVIAHLMGAAKAWCNGQVPDDDMTFVVLKVKA